MQQQPPPPEAMEEEEDRAGAPKAAGPELGFWTAARRRLPPDDPFFAAGDLERELLAKHVALDLSEDERHRIEKMQVAGACTVFCPIAGCGAQLGCLEEFEDHYIARHTASCSVCSRVYPTSRLLSIHVSEAHDSYFQAKVARGFPMYECLVEGCGVKLRSYKSRQQHLIDKHQFPKSFEFFKKARPSQRQRQKNQRKQAAGHHHKGDEEAQMDVDGKKGTTTRQAASRRQQHADDHNNNSDASKGNDDRGQHKGEEEAEKGEDDDGMEVEELASAVSRLSTADSSTPANVTFGHRRSRGLTFVPRSIRQQNKQAAQPEAKKK